MTQRKPFTANQQNEKKKKLKLSSKGQPTLDSFLQKKSQEDTTTAAKTESAHDQGLKNNGVSVDDHSSKDSDVSSVYEPTKSKEMHFSPQKNKLPETIDANEYHQKDQPCHSNCVKQFVASLMRHINHVMVRFWIDQLESTKTERESFLLVGSLTFLG